MSNREILGYKIKNKKTGLYMNKGSVSGKHAFSSKGATWSQLSHAIASLKLKAFTETEILELEVVELIERHAYSSAFLLDKLVK